MGEHFALSKEAKGALAVNWLVLFQNSPAIVFILGMAFFVMMMTNFIMNVAAIAISLPVALVIAPYLGVGGEVILFSAWWFLICHSCSW